jgi:glutamate synthase domain-containing protein 3
MSMALDLNGVALREGNARLRRSAESGEEVKVSNASHLKGLCGGLKKGTVVVEGDVGDYFGILNDGASLTVDGSAGRFIGDNMTAGKIVVRGDVGDGAADYCYGGMVVIGKSAGDFLGTMNKGATVVVSGDVGDHVGTYMTAGDIIVLGDAGEALGDYIIRGSIYIRGSYKSLGRNTKLEKIRSDDIDRLNTVLGKLSIQANARSFQKVAPASSKPFYQEKPAVSQKVVGL